MAKHTLPKMLFSVMMLGLVASPLMNVGSAHADSGIKVVVDGQQIHFDAQPFEENNRTMVPIRAIAEALGSNVSFVEGNAQKIIIKNSDHDVELTIGASLALVDKKWVTLDEPAKIVNHRTFVPVRFVSENLEANVNWDESTSTVNITSKGAQVIKQIGGSNMTLLHPSPVSNKTNAIPTVFIHGLFGDEGAFSSAIRDLHSYFPQDQGSYTYITNQVISGIEAGSDTKTTFEDDGQDVTFHVDQSGNIEERDFRQANKFVKIVFIDNTSSLTDQAIWLANVLKKVKQMYNTDQINVVAHSMGGLVTIKYIEDTNPYFLANKETQSIYDTFESHTNETFTENDVVRVNRFVTLGTPVKGSYLENLIPSNTKLAANSIASGITSTGIYNTSAFPDLDPEGHAIQNLQSNMAGFDPHTVVLSVAGTKLGPIGDGAVTEDSALGLRDLTDNFSYELADDIHTSLTNDTTVLGDFHTSLTNDTTVLGDIASFLWGPPLLSDLRIPYLSSMSESSAGEGVSPFRQPLIDGQGNMFKHGFLNGNVSSIYSEYPGLNGSFSQEYELDGKYHQLSGTIFSPISKYFNKGNMGMTNITISGDGKVLYELDNYNYLHPNTDFKVDVTGVETLKVEFDQNDNAQQAAQGIVNVLAQNDPTLQDANGQPSIADYYGYNAVGIGNDQLQ